MRSGMSSCEKKGWFNFTLLKKNLTRFWPLWVLYALALFLLLDMPLINLERANSAVFTADKYMVVYGSGSALAGEVYRSAMIGRYGNVIRWAMEDAVYLGAVFGCLLAMAFFSYLMNRRSVGMIHALPIKREGLFFTNWVSGLLFVVGPSLAAFVIALLAEAGKGAVGLKDLLLWLLVNGTVTLFFFDFAVCCAMFTGHILALPVFYLILNFLVAGMYYFFLEAQEVLIVGCTASAGSLGTPVELLTPVMFLSDRAGRWNEVTLADGSVYSSLAEGAFQASAYAILGGLLLLFIAFWVYRLRQMERAEDLVTVNWVKPIFRYGVGVCAGFVVGAILYEYFFPRGVWAYIALVTLCAVIGGFVGQMFLRKTLRVLRSGWKGSLALGCCILLLLVGVRMDLLGVQTRVPDPEDVEYVYVSGPWSEPSDDAGYLSLTLKEPELIAEVTQLHRTLTQDLDRVERASQEGWPSDENTQGMTFRVSYTMKDGSELTRRYDTVPVTKAELEDPDSFGSQLQALMNEPTMLAHSYLRSEEEAGEFEAVGGTLSARRYDEAITLSHMEAQALWQAIREDLAAGRYHRYLFATDEVAEMGWYIDLDLYQQNNGERNVTATIVDEKAESTVISGTIGIRVQPTATSTLETLEKLGCVEWLESPERDNR